MYLIIFFFLRLNFSIFCLFFNLVLLFYFFRRNRGSFEEEVQGGTASHRPVSFERAPARSAPRVTGQDGENLQGVQGLLQGPRRERVQTHGK